MHTVKCPTPFRTTMEVRVKFPSSVVQHCCMYGLRVQELKMGVAEQLFFI